MLATDNQTDFRILVIDDNPAIHHDFIKILSSSEATTNLDDLSQKIFGKKDGHDITLPNFVIDTASQGEEGVDYIKQSIKDKKPYSLAFVDIRMPPGWDGVETIKHIWEIDKDIQIVICTAYSDYSWEETVSHLGKTDNLLILKKPFDNVSVRQLACALTKKWQLLQATRKFTTSLKKQIEDRTESLEKTLSLVKATLESSDEGIIVISNSNEIMNFNGKFQAMWDFPDEVLNSKDANKLFRCIKNLLRNPGDIEILTGDNNQQRVNIDIIELNDGRVFDCYSQPQVVNDKIIGKVLNFRDITDRKLLETTLQYQATHDPLTSLPNRAFLIDIINQRIEAAKENNAVFGILYFDLDRFKLINDSLSHEAGDNLLRKTAQRIKVNINEDDTLARLGGDEFVVVTNIQEDEKEIIKKANQLHVYFLEPFSISNREIVVTASIGISIYPTNGDSPESLLRNADAAMYHVKENGSNAFQVYSEDMNTKALEKLEREAQLRKALINNELYLCYQPEYDIFDENMMSVEALIRWNHPKLGTLLPMDFIPLAEETGLIIPIGEWVMRTACTQIKKLHESGFSPIRVAINVTGHQLKQINFIDTVKNILEETQLDPQFVEFELTENIVISNLEVINTVKELKNLGVSITIDDFGTGYSSLSYLKKIPLDRLKIDGSFIRNIQSKTDDEIIIRAIIAFAKNLNLKVLAEGVETQEQFEFLKNQRCHEIQGFYFNKPLLFTELIDLMKKA